MAEAGLIACQVRLAKRNVVLSGFITSIYASKNSEVLRFTHSSQDSTLPPSIIVKIHSEDKWMQAEAVAYAQLLELQGNMIPVCYGKVYILGTKKQGLGLQEIDGQTISQLLRSGYEPNEILFDDIRSCFRRISGYGVCALDDNPANLILPVDPTTPSSRVIMIDFAWAELREGDTCLERNLADAESIIWKISQR